MTLSVDLICLQYICRDAARHVGLSATADPCLKLILSQINVTCLTVKCQQRLCD